jgi:hypothetical protein
MLLLPFTISTAFYKMQKKLHFFTCCTFWLLQGLFWGNLSAQTKSNQKITLDSVALRFSQTITEADLKKHLSILASDAYEGRETGTKGQKMAAEYLRTFFQNENIGSPLNNYFQTFELDKKNKLPQNTLTINKKTLQNKKDYFFIGNWDEMTTQRQDLLFVGYGIEDEKYNDYARVQAAGKILMILMGEPKTDDQTYLLSGTNKPSSWSKNEEKLKIALKKKAKGVVWVYENDALFSFTLKQYEPYLNRASYDFKTEKEEKDLKDYNLPQIYLSRSAFFKIIKWNDKKMKQEIEAAIAQKGVWKQNLQTDFLLDKTSKAETIQTENVIAFIEGTDKKEEVLVISAHYDHIGIIRGQINNGADDDGSGTVTVMELAQAFQEAKKAGFAPRRSIAFMLFTGEEKGLLGSEYYSNNPIFEHKQVIANLNIDMVGRIDNRYEDNPDYIYIIGSDMLSDDLHQLQEQVAKLYAPQIKLDYTYNDKDDPNQFYYRSDHYNFAKHNIPVIFYFNGTHEDYHQPTDEVEKIHFGKMQNIGRLIFCTAWHLVQAENRPALK